jgi:hypothetical protein
MSLTHANRFGDFADRVAVPASEEPGVEGVLGAETWVDEPAEGSSKLDLKREDWEGVGGPVRTELLPAWTENWNRNAYLYHQPLRFYPGS